MKLWLQFVALVLMLLSMPIVSYGTTEESRGSGGRG
jgi:hypothetical protein